MNFSKVAGSFAICKLMEFMIFHYNHWLWQPNKTEMVDGFCYVLIRDGSRIF